jgi:hypothetical protein
MRSRPGRLVRFLVFVLCVLDAGLGVAACLGSHRGSPAEAHYCGTPTGEAMSALAETAPDAFSDAYRRMTGSDDGCCLACPGCGPSAPGIEGARSLAPPGAAVPGAVGPALGACRFGAHKPPSTAPPLLS